MTSVRPCIASLLAGLVRRPAVLALTVAGCLGTAASCVASDGDARAIEVASRMLDGLPNDVATDGSLAIVGLDTGLATYALSDAHALRLLGRVALPGPALEVTEGPLALAACGEAGCFVIDVADPTAPAIVGRMRPSGNVSCAASRDGVAFVAASGGAGDPGGTLEAYSLADSSSPMLLGAVVLPGEPRCITLLGSRVLVGMGGGSTGRLGGVMIVDASDPTTLVPVETMAFELPVNAIALRGNVAFVGTGMASIGTVESVDLTDPVSPRWLGRLPQPDAVEDVAVDGEGTLLAAASSLGILRIDTSDPARMFKLDARPTGRYSVAIGLSGADAIVAERSSIGAGGLTVVSVPGSGRLEVGSVEPLAEVTSVAVADGISFVLSRDALRVVDARDPRAPRLLSTWKPADADFSKLALEGGLAAVGQGSEILLVDASDPLRLRPRGRIHLEGGVATDLAFAGNALLAADGWALEVIDVTDPDSPAIRATYTPRTWASSVSAEGTLAVVAGGTGLEIIDVSVPSAPLLAGRVDVGDFLFTTTIRGNLVLAAGQASSLITVDITSPSAPRVLGRLPGGPGYDLSVDGDRVAVAAGSTGALVCDISRPAAPCLVGSFDTSGVALAVALDTDVVHVAGEGAGYWCLVHADVPMIASPSSGESARWRRPAEALSRRTQDGAGARQDEPRPRLRVSPGPSAS